MPPPSPPKKHAQDVLISSYFNRAQPIGVNLQMAGENMQQMNISSPSQTQVSHSKSFNSNPGSNFSLVKPNLSSILFVTATCVLQQLINQHFFVYSNIIFKSLSTLLYIILDTYWESLSHLFVEHF